MYQKGGCEDVRETITVVIGWTVSPSFLQDKVTRKLVYKGVYPYEQDRGDRDGER